VISYSESDSRDEFREECRRGEKSLIRQANTCVDNIVLKSINDMLRGAYNLRVSDKVPRLISHCRLGI
jgi:hypothetical protein